MNPPASIEIASSGSGEAAFRVPPQLAQDHETADAELELAKYLDGKVRHSVMKAAAPYSGTADACDGSLWMDLNMQNNPSGKASTSRFTYGLLNMCKPIDALSTLAAGMMVDGKDSFASGAFFVGKEPDINQVIIIRKCRESDRHHAKVYTHPDGDYESLKPIPGGAAERKQVDAVKAAFSACPGFYTNMTLKVTQPQKKKGLSVKRLSPTRMLSKKCSRCR